MASFLGSIFRTPRKEAAKPREDSPEDDLSPESVLSSPTSAASLVRNGHPSSLKKLKRKRASTDAPAAVGDDDESVAPGAEGMETDAAVPDAVMPSDASPKDASKAVKPHASNTTESPGTGPSGVKQSPTVSKKPPRASKGGGDDELYTIESIQKHRWVDDDIELQIKWDTGDLTWEPETSIQEDAPAVLFSYWASEGGRPPHPSHPDLFHIFAVRKVTPRSKKVLVEWVGFKEQTWEPRSTVEEAAPELLEQFEARQSRGRKRRRRH
ncbi:hypothetical protein NLU13_6287 [Sarocladium strictum]|uniref:Chromo domain-containing protein n=1 Tax=Sarocladium strictum TaxID=5046 RepID=A0AA39GFY7_SARSR|nr:hypothetical protein NLU13_6287 [Sarocladium strictum]